MRFPSNPRDLFVTVPMTADQAKQEALSCLRDNRRINNCEFAYSPSTGAVGCRWHEATYFKVFNAHYPMYKRNDEVTDWVSVGKGTKT